MRATVARWVDRLDESFVTAIDIYIATSAERGQTEIAELLTEIREEVLGSLRGKLPGPMQVLDVALRLTNRWEREGGDSLSCNNHAENCRELCMCVSFVG